MANRMINNVAGDARNQQDIKNPHQLLSTNKTRSTEKSDDVIVSLSDAYENRRARQVGEWEKLYGQNVYRGA